MYNAKETKMSTVTYERWPVTSAMKATLKSYILKQKQKKKEEEEQDAVLDRERKIREIKRQQDTATLEQTNDQIEQMEKKLEYLKKEKHDLFAQLKKVLNQEEEQRRRVQQLQLQHDREKSEVLAKVGPPPPNLLGLPGASPPQVLLKPLSNPGSSPGQAAVPTISLQGKRPRSPSPHTSVVVNQSPQTPSGFLSPKRATPPYQRSPYQPSSGSIFSPRSIVPHSIEPNRFPPPVPTAIPPPVVVPSPFGRIPIDLNIRSPQYEVRPVAPQATHLPARIPQHVPPVNIPILPPQQKMGSITSGFPLHRPNVNVPIGMPTNRLPFAPPKHLPTQPSFTQQPHQRM